MMAGTLFVVATPIGNLEDVSARALRVLRDVAVIAAEDTRRTSRLLARYGITTRTTSLHEHNEAAKSASLLARLAAGESVALVSDAGTPSVSDPGERLTALASAAGIRIEPIPGPSAVMTVVSASGLPADSFLFLGFAPIPKRARSAWISELVTSRRTVVFFEAPHRIQRTLAELSQYLGKRQIVVGRELTKLHETILRGSTEEVLQQLGAPKGEFVVVVEGHEIGETTENVSTDPSSASVTLSEPHGGHRGLGPKAQTLGQMSNIVRRSRRDVISELASELGLSPNKVYRALEEAGKSVD